MASFNRSNSNNWIFSVKILLTSSGVLSMVMILKISIPVLLEFISSGVPLFWKSLLSWLTPPYLYIVLNFIIITIAASSRFHHKIEEQQSESPFPAKIAATRFEISPEYDSVMLNNSIPVEVKSQIEGMDSYDVVPIKNPVEVNLGFVNYDEIVKNPVDNQIKFQDLGPKLYENEESSGYESKITEIPASSEENDGFVISKSTWTSIRPDLMEIPPYSPEKPPASTRFNHRKPVKANPEGSRTLGVTKPKKHETLESTWKTITEGRGMPLTRHLKKSDTWETHGRHNHHPNQEEQMKKSETFKERHTNQSSPSSGKLRKEPSLSQDDLNRRVEAFIKKFNEEMRLQRQESLNQYKEIVNPGTY